MASVADLPPEILLKIFEYLPLKDILAISHISAGWTWLTRFRSLYKIVVIDVDVKLEQVSRILTTYARTVEAVTLMDRQDVNAVLELLVRCSNLKQLKIKNCRDAKDECVSTALLVNIFKRTKLTNFSMKKCTCFIHVLSILPPEPRTRKMIGFSARATDSATQDLHYLGPHFFSMLESSADSLIYLRIEDANINFLTTDFSTLFHLIGNCRKLKELSYNVCYLPITDEHFYEIYNLNSLTSLSLKSLRRISDKVFRNFFDVNRTGRIKKLELHDVTTVNEQTIRCIGTGCPELENLTLYQCTSSQEKPLTKEALMELPYVCRMLQVMRLSYLDDSFVDVLVFLSEKLCNLKLLEFEGLTRGEYIFNLKSVLSEAMPNFDIKLSRFGRITCQPKRRYLFRFSVLNQNYQIV